MQLVLQRPAELEKQLDALIQDQQVKGSPNYHKWLTAAEFGQRFGIAQSDVETVTNWLKNEGFHVDAVFPNGMTIEFSGDAGKIKSAFHTEIHNLEVNGEKHIANMSDPSVPSALAKVVGGVYSLNDFAPHKMVKKHKFYTTGNANVPYLIAPADLATLYNLNPAFAAGYTGTGQTIVVVEDTNVYSTGDWNTFRSTFGLAGYTNASFTQIHPTGSATCSNPGVNSDEDEAILDAQWASAAAPNATIQLASCTDGRAVSTFGGLVAIENIENAAGPYPQIISMSYGESEPDDGSAGNAAFKTAFQQAASEGISVFVSSGDELAASTDGGNYNATHGITISGWMSSAYNVSVGGTDLGDAYLAKEGNPAVPQTDYWSATNTASYGSALSYIPEVPWTNSCTSALSYTYDGYTSPLTFCNSVGTAANNFASYGGSGGPSNCATGTASTSGVANGTCAGWPKPTWQVAPGVPADGVRDTPDISLMASNGQWGHYYPSCDSDPNFPDNYDSCSGTPDNWGGGGGTSYSSPILAGMQALINQATGATTGMGNPNPRYYQLASIEYSTPSGLAACNSTLGAAIGSTCVFNDVTLGDISSACSALYKGNALTGTYNCYGSGGTKSAPVYGISSTSNSSEQIAYNTGQGWDFATGLGSVNAFNLINNWVSVQTTTTVTAPTTSPTYGQSLTFTATVVPAIGSSETGTVTWSSNTGCTASTVSGGIATCTTTRLPAGADTVTATYSGDATYAGSNGSLGETVSKAVLTVIASNVTINVGGTIPALTATYSGFVNDDTPAVLTGAPSLTTTATSSNSPGAYPITVSAGTLSSPNYSFSFVNGTLSIIAQQTTVILSTSATLSGSASSGYTATITITNTGTGAASNVVLSTATLGGVSGSGLPRNLGSIPASGSAIVLVSFPGSVGADGARSAESFAGTYTGGNFSGSVRAVLP